MKRLRVIGFEEERDELLQKLLHLGCVEISEPEDKLTDPEWTALLRRDGSALTDRKAEAAALSSALDALKKYAPAKKGLFIKRKQISEADFFSESVKAEALQGAERINECTREIARIYSAENKLKSNLANLAPWSRMDVPLDGMSTAHTQLILGTVPAAVELGALQNELSQATDLAELSEISSDKDQHYLLLIVHNSAAEDALAALRPHSFGVIHFKDMAGTVAENQEKLRAEIDALNAERKQPAAGKAPAVPGPRQSGHQPRGGG